MIGLRLIRRLIECALCTNVRRLLHVSVIGLDLRIKVIVLIGMINVTGYE